MFGSSDWDDLIMEARIRDCVARMGMEIVNNAQNGEVNVVFNQIYDELCDCLGMENINNVIDINKNLPHLVSKVKCNVCGHEWIAVYPSKADGNKLQCSVCREMNSKVLSTYPEEAFLQN